MANFFCNPLSFRRFSSSALLLSKSQKGQETKAKTSLRIPTAGFDVA
jgi:hypothetical protein